MTEIRTVRETSGEWSQKLSISARSVIEIEVAGRYFALFWEKMVDYEMRDDTAPKKTPGSQK
jgi:hypothetical protein